MAVKVYQRVPNGDYEEVPGRLRFGTLDVGVKAEEASSDQSTIKLDDAAGDFSDIGGFRGFVISEDSATDGILAILRGYTQDREYAWEDLIEGFDTGRVISVTVDDINSIFGRRVLVGDDAKRPAETDVERMQWAILTNEAALIDDDTYLNTDDPVDMDAADYRGQYLQAVVDDCMEASGKNCFLTWVEGPAEFSIFYAKPSADTFSSIGRLTNVGADVNETHMTDPTFIVESVKLKRLPGRVYSGVYLTYQDAFVYKQREATAQEFARRDAIMSATNVTSSAKANARANRLITDLSTEEDRFEIAVNMPITRVNLIRPGQRFRVKFSRFDPEGYADEYVWVRALSIRYTQTNLRYYHLEIEAVALAETDPSEGAGAYAILYGSHGPYGGGYNEVWWESDGDAPMVGAPVIPTSGLVEPWEPGSPPLPGYTHAGFNILGTGTIDARLSITALGVTAVSSSVTFAICLNGTVVESQAFPITRSGFYGSWSEGVSLTVTGLAVAPGDKLTATVTKIPADGFVVPGGTGGAGETFEITGGTLA